MKKMIVFVCGAFLVSQIFGEAERSNLEYKNNRIIVFSALALTSGLLANGTYAEYRKEKSYYNKLRDPNSPDSLMINANGGSSEKSNARRDKQIQATVAIVLASISLTCLIISAKNAFQLRAGAKNGNTGMWIEEKF